MTDTTKAPERLYFYDDWLAKNTKGKLLCGNNEYIRKDVSDALIAAAYEDAAEVAFGSLSNGTGVRDEILAQTPDDARAALAARDQRVREEALREAAAMAKGCALLIAPESVSQRVGAKSVQSQVASQILEALIEKDQDNG